MRDRLLYLRGNHLRRLTFPERLTPLRCVLFGNLHLLLCLIELSVHRVEEFRVLVVRLIELLSFLEIVLICELQQVLLSLLLPLFHCKVLFQVTEGL